MLITHSISEAVFLSDRVYVMSTSPGTIREIVDIEPPRPRALDMTSTAEFASRYVKARKSVRTSTPCFASALAR